MVLADDGSVLVSSRPARATRRGRWITAAADVTSPTPTMSRQDRDRLGRSDRTINNSRINKYCNNPIEQRNTEKCMARA